MRIADAARIAARARAAATAALQWLRWLLVGDRDGSEAKAREATAFLPAALEVEETPPLSATRRILWLIVLFFGAAVLWACLGHVDIIVSAQGKVIPSGRVKVIQPLEAGVVTAIHVRDGQQVKAGDPLVDLDTTATAADEARVNAELAAAGSDRDRYRKLQRAIEAGERLPPAEAGSGTDGQLLYQQWQEYAAKKESVARDIERLEAQRAATRESIHKLEQLLPIATERLQALENLSDKNLAPRHTVLELKERQIETAQELKVQRHRLVESEAQIASLRGQQRSLEAEVMGNLLAKLQDAELRASALEQERVKAAQRGSYQSLKAPIGGTVKQIAVNTIGGVVTPAQELMQIVPSDETLEIEAFIENKDIGFVAAGQSVEIKVDAFPFTRFGVLPGALKTISADAVFQEGIGLIYPSRILVASQSEPFRLVPGMSSTVEIKTGRRTIMEFLLSPLIARGMDSMRER